MINIQETARLAHERAMLAGWWDEPRSMNHAFFLVKGELHEAAEALRIGKHAPVLTTDNLPLTPERFKELVKDTFEDEIADAAIRLLDLLGCVHAERNEAFWHEIQNSIEFFEFDSDEMLVELLDIISRKLDKLSLNFERVGLAMQYTLSDIFCYLYGIAKKMNFNLDLHIIAKMDYNQTRGIRHGKKF